MMTANNIILLIGIGIGIIITLAVEAVLLVIVWLLVGKGRAKKHE